METLSTIPSRRKFLRDLGLGSSAMLLAGLPSLASGQSNARPSPRPMTSTDAETNLAFMSAAKIAELIREKKVSAVEVVEAAIERIEFVNPSINAVVFKCYERARAEAIEADRMLARGMSKGPLHGVPMTIKDSIDTAGVRTTGGTIGRANYVPGKDATAVARLRGAGAILLGKSNTPEWTLAGGAIPGVSTTANIIYGFTRNPYDVTRSVAGSSGGAGAIVAAGGPSFDIGTDWGGSVRGPAHMCGIAGIKPTFGRIPRTGHIVDYGGIHDSWQQFGPMTRRVEDLILLMSIMSGSDGIDAAIPPMPWPEVSPLDVKGLRVAWFTESQSGATSPETQKVVKDCAAMFETMGAVVTHDYPEAHLKELNGIRSQISREARHGLKRLAKKWGSNSPSPTVLGRNITEGPTTVELVELLEKQDHNRSKMLQWVKNYDLIINPVFGNPAGVIDAGINDNGSTVNTRGSNFNGIYNTTGWPAAVVRAGTSSEGLPIGVQLIGQPWKDDLVLAASAIVEKEMGGWKRPPM